MKNTAKLRSIIALVAVIGFSIAALSLTSCDTGGGSGPGDDTSITYRGIDANGNSYTLEITKSPNRAAFVPQPGDPYVLTVRNPAGEVIARSTGTVSAIGNNGEITLAKDEGGQIIITASGEALSISSGTIPGVGDNASITDPDISGSGDPGSGPGSGTTSNGKVITDIKFDLSGATAILAAEPGSQGRAAYSSNNTLFKILADDSVAPLFDSSSISNSTPPNVRFLARSPVQGKKDLYVCFNGDWYIYIDGYQEGDTWVEGKNISIGSLIHIKEDGSIISIVSSEDGSWNSVNTYQNNDPVAFDSSGNLYFTVNESSGSSNTNVIYKYDPVTSRKVLLVAAAPNTSYEKVQLSSDGVYIIARGYRWSNNNNVAFLRVIPTANPNVYENIHYDSTGTGSIYSFALNPRSKDVYVSGYNLIKEDPNDRESNYLSGFFKITVNGMTQNDIKWTPIFTSNYYGGKPQFVAQDTTYVDGYFEYDEEESATWVDGYYEYSYSWSPEYCDEEGYPDYDKMMEALYGYFLSESIEFRHPDYRNNRLINEAALAKLYTDGALESIYGKWDYNSEINYPSDYCYRIDNTKATRYNGSFDLSYIRDIYVAANNSVWGIVTNWNNNSNSKVFVQLIGSNGKRDFYIPKSTENRIVLNFKPTESHVYFCADVTTGYQESGFQNIYRFSYSDPDTGRNMFDSIRTRDKQYMEVFSYDISGNHLYFGGTQGTTLLTGKIDLTTYVYTELEFAQKIITMLTY